MKTADVDITAIAPSGEGVAQLKGATISIPFTIPGERVRIGLEPQRLGPPRARLLAVLSASPHRVPPACSHFGDAARPAACGGCSWQHIAYSEQLKLKTALVVQLVAAKLAPPAPTVHSMLPAVAVDEPWRFRHKAHFVFGSDERSLIMGHYARGSRRVIPISECPVHDPRANDIAFDIYEALRAARIPPAATGRGRSGPLKHLSLRVSASHGDTMATLVVSANQDKRLRAAIRTVIARHNDLKSFHINVHTRDDAFIFGRHTQRVHGAARLREDVADTAFLVSPTAFFQTNVRAAEILVRLVLARVPPGASVLDLYSGAGLFALPLAIRGHRVVAIEENRLAVKDGEASARRNQIDESTCSFLTGAVEAMVSRVTADKARSVILDPPRAGCDPLVIEQVFGRLRPDNAIYVSCEPSALAIDLKAIASWGYQIEAIQPVDMFPHTAHIETVAYIRRRD